MWVIFFGDVAIAIAAIYGVVKVSGPHSNVESTVSIPTSAFTAIGTMTTAYFGIRAVSNTAQQVATTHSLTAGKSNGDGSTTTGAASTQAQSTSSASTPGTTATTDAPSPETEQQG
jgi:hypothetical protein